MIERLGERLARWRQVKIQDVDDIKARVEAVVQRVDGLELRVRQLERKEEPGHESQ